MLSTTLYGYEARSWASPTKMTFAHACMSILNLHPEVYLQEAKKKKKKEFSLFNVSSCQK